MDERERGIPEDTVAGKDGAVESRKDDIEDVGRTIDFSLWALELRKTTLSLWGGDMRMYAFSSPSERGVRGHHSLRALLVSLGGRHQAKEPQVRRCQTAKRRKHFRYLIINYNSPQVT